MIEHVEGGAAVETTSSCLFFVLISCVSELVLSYRYVNKLTGFTKAALWSVFSKITLLTSHRVAVEKYVNIF